MTRGRIPVEMTQHSVAFIRKIEEQAPAMITLFQTLRETFGTKSNWLALVFSSDPDYLNKYKEHKFDLLSVMDRGTAYRFVGHERAEEHNATRRYRVVELSDSGTFSDIYEFEAVNPQGEDA